MLQQMYFIRSVCNAESPRLGIHLSDQLILAHPFCTIDLNGSIQHSSCNLRDDDLHVNLIAFERQTFAIAMCVKAPFAPTRSIISAAFSTRSLADSISNLNSASCARKRSLATFQMVCERDPPLLLGSKTLLSRSCQYNVYCCENRE